MKKCIRKGQLYKRGKRSLALLLSVCLIGTMIPVTARAESGNTNTGLCEHHTEHTAECGYVAPVEGHACEHVHDEECGYVEGSVGSPCAYVCDICKEEAEQGKTDIIPEENLTVQTQEQTTDKLITAWQWVDEEEYLDEETGSLSLPGASEQTPAYFDDVTAFLPTQIEATVVNAEDTDAESGEEIINLGDWNCEDYPKEGAYSGSYTFAATLPEGYVLSDEAEALTVLVELGGAQQYGTVTSISYLDKDGNTQNCESATEVTSEDTSWGTSGNDTWYVVNGDVTIGSAEAIQRVTVYGNVHLILTDGCNLIVNGGIGVGLDSSLTIYGQTAGTGALEARNVGDRNAGIGGGNGGNFSGGAITINGGTITATGGNAGAGIGGGGVSGSGYLYDKGGPIIINGGTINANGGLCGAGIGDGKKGAGGRTITINGGTINAIGTDYAAGIGSGDDGSSGGRDNGSIIINISGGSITATGGYKGAGIGCGSSDNGGVTINISGGTINATGGAMNDSGTEYAAGIGKGYYSKKTVSVSITNSVVMASSISDTGSQSSWNGLIFEGDAGKAYGTSVNVTTDCTIPSGKLLVVAAEQTISIAETATFTNEGNIYNSGTFNGAIENSGTIHNTGTISGASGGTINQYSIAIEQTETSCQSATLTLKVNDTAFGESVTYTLSDDEANAVIENGNTLKVVDSGFGTPIPVTATFTVDGVSMTRTEDVTITGHDYDKDGFCTECDAYQPATLTTDKYDIDGDDAKDNVYEIGNAGQLYWFADKVNTDNANYGSANAVLTADITVNSNLLNSLTFDSETEEVTNGTDFRSWTPIGKNIYPNIYSYTGTFDGNNKTVSGLYFNNTSSPYVGLFGYVGENGTVKNVGVVDSYFRGSACVGGVCGGNKGGIIENCYNEGNVTGSQNVAYVGGVCGDNQGGTITNCYNTGEVNGTSIVGGVCGSSYHVYDSSGQVTNQATITNCYNTGAVNITVTSTNNTEVYVGGVCAKGDGTITNCYYLEGTANGGINGVDVTGSAEVKTAVQFASGEVCYLLNSSSSENPVWYQNIDLDGETADAYPVLDSNHGTVYQSTPCPIEYSNTPDKTVAHIFHADENDNTKHICEKCGYSEAHSTTNLTYSADEETNRITVYCNEGGCGTNIGYVELAAPSGTITYDGTEKKATVSDTVDGVDFSTGTVITYKQGETTLLSAPTDAGTYTASITLGTGTGAATVSVEFTVAPATPTISWGMLSGSTWVEMTSMPVTYTGSEIAPNKLVPPTVTLVNGETYSGEISYSYRVQGSSDTFTSGLPTDIGAYEVKASIAADGNYTAAASTVTLTVEWLNILNSATLTDQGGIELTGDTWWAQSVTFTAPTGFTISNSLTDSFGTSFVYNEQTGADGTEVTYYLKNGNGEIAKKTATVRIDKTAPDWNGENDGISIKTNKWKSLLSTISFGLFYKENVDVKVCASDSLSGMAAYYYYVDSTGGTVKTAGQLDALNFTEYTEGVSGQNPTVTVTSLAPDGNYIVYAYAVDAAGNRSAYVCSEGVVVDSTAPAISNIVAPSKESSTLTDTAAQISFTGSEAGTYFYMVKESSETAPTTITDFATSDADSKGMTTWTAKPNVSSASMKADADNKITLSNLNANTEYILYLVAVDLAGNSSTVYSQNFTTCRTMPTVADADMPKISGTYGQTVEDMTLTPGTAKVGNDTITGTWAVNDSSKTDVPAVGTTNTYQVTFTPDMSYNGMYDTVNVQVTPTVAQKPVTVTAENKTKTYGQENPAFTFTVPEGALVGTDTNEALAVELSCEAKVNSPVTTEGYTITGTSSSANYEVTVIPGNLTIEKADATIIVETGKDSYSKTFGDADFTLSGISDTNTEADVQYAVTAGEDVVSVSNGTVTILNAGTATITVSLPASTNYNAADSKTITVTVEKKSGYTVADISKSYLYSRDNAENIDLSKYLPSNCGTVSYGTPQVNEGLYTDGGQPEVSSDGKLSYTVKTGSVGDNGTIKVAVTTVNYVDFTITVNVNLTDKLPVSLKDGASVTLQNSILTYGQTLSTLAFNSAVFVNDGGNVVAGTLSWKTPDEKPNAGTTSATWVFTPDDEAYAAVEDTVAITVNKATPNVTALPTVTARTYHPTASLTNDDLVGGTVNVEGSWSWQSANIIPVVNNSGYVAVFTPTDSTNYETVTKTITVTVSKATPYIATAPTAAAITYGDTLGASTLNGGTVQYSDSDATTVSGSFAWKDNAVKPSVSDSNTTTYRLVFTPSDAVNYNTAETDITLTVNKADNAPNMPSSTMNVANSCTKVSDVTIPTGWVWQDADKNTALVVDTPVTATAVYNGADKGNYENETVSVSITRSECEHAHTEVRNAKESTCKETGYTGDTYCTDCGALLSTGTTIPLADHQGGTATCTKKAVCTVCGKEYGTLDANNHVHTEIKGAVAATCTAGGYTGDTYCTDCGVKIKTGTAIPAFGHNYTGKVTTEPTTDREGVRTYTCDRCGHSYTESIPKLPEETHEHSYSGSVTKEPTCTDTGVRTYTCSCGDSYTETIPALGHHYVSSVTKEPTTSSEGVMTYTCDRCGHSYTRAIAKLQDTNNNNPGENQPGAENKPDTGKPYIKDENGKEGWDVIKDEVDKTKDGDTVTVEMNGTSVVPGDVLDDIKGKDVTIVFDMGGGITWSVNGKSITADRVGDIDFTVKADTNTIPVDIINNVTGERYSKQISLSYDGEFGFTAVLSINMEASNAGLYANLFYYNEKTGEMEFICADEIAADGTAELTFTHASDYAIVIDKEPMEGSVQVDRPASESQDTETESTQTGAEVSNDAWNPWWIIVIGIMVIVIGLGVFLVAKKNKSDDE